MPRHTVECPYSSGYGDLHRRCFALFDERVMKEPLCHSGRFSRGVREAAQRVDTKADAAFSAGLKAECGCDARGHNRRRMTPRIAAVADGNHSGRTLG
ncbi:hypothetical protein MRX96_005618 [Rhipicephalus microplus]